MSKPSAGVVLIAENGLYVVAYNSFDADPSRFYLTTCLSDATLFIHKKVAEFVGRDVRISHETVVRLTAVPAYSIRVVNIGSIPDA